MAAPSSIDRHPERERIIEAIGNGVPGVDISRRYGVSESAVSRYRISRKDVLAQIIDEDGTDPTEVLGRLLDLSDSARVARKLADATGSPAVRARVIAAELSVLDRLSRLNIDDTTTARLAQAVGPLVRTVYRLARLHPEEVFGELAKHDELADLKHDLQAALKRENGRTHD